MESIQSQCAVCKCTAIQEESRKKTSENYILRRGGDMVTASSIRQGSLRKGAGD